MKHNTAVLINPLNWLRPTMFVMATVFRAMFKLHDKNRLVFAPISFVLVSLVGVIGTLLIFSGFQSISSTILLIAISIPVILLIVIPFYAVFFTMAAMIFVSAVEASKTKEFLKSPSVWYRWSMHNQYFIIHEARELVRRHDEARAQK